MTNEAIKTAPLETASEDVNEGPLLFCEILLEEHEGLNQPDLNAAEVEEIRKKIKAYREKPEEQSQSEFEGPLLKRIYRLIYEAQAEKAKRETPPEESDNKTSNGGGKKKITDGAPPVIQALANIDAVAQQGNGIGYGDPIIPQRPEKLTACTLRSALCLSGGGVRSATFNLGILQGLARHGLLDRFDYLSTVSGGGFIGGWLSAWIRRDGTQKVVNDLKKTPESPLIPDPYPVEHLRIYSNYLSPRPGLLSADTWTLVASVVRNLVLNWLVFVPVFLALLMLPRMWTSIVLRSTHHPAYAIWIWLGIGFLAGLWALSYIGRNLPSSNEYKPAEPHTKYYKGGQGKFITYCLIPLVVSAAALAVCLWICYQPSNKPKPSLPWYYYSLFMAVVSGLAWLTCLPKISRVTPKEKKGSRYLGMVWGASVVVIVVVPLILGFIASSVIVLSLPIFHKYTVVYSVFSVPLILLLMGVKGVLITGFTSRFSKDDDQEWWARAGGWVLIVVLAWSVVHLLVLYGPLLLLTLGGPYRALMSGGLRKLAWADWGKLIATIMGIVSGAVTLVGGFSAKTPANSKEAERAGSSGLLLAVATQMLAPVFLGFLIILLSFGTNWLLISRPSQWISKLLGTTIVPDVSYPLWKWHDLLLNETPFRLLFVVAILVALLGVAMGWLISTNAFSLQYLWRNRIIRAYLGASHPKRNPDHFTGFDSYDNLQMHELWPEPGREECSKREDRPTSDMPSVRESRKLFHVLNMALNLTGGEKLQWQDRKAESFTVSPLHAGSYWLGYRRSKQYGGKDGITLGASVAISGAFVSPNMGYMMTSPIVRFLMAVFNVRFGWWQGNPGRAGEETFHLDSPRLSVRPFLEEAFGLTDDKAPYVYLSDGGHFENLGLYEMVLRRCRFIVVSDASTDPDYSFQSLAMSIRQIRVDLGVPIEIPEMAVGAPSQNLRSKYCAIGKIRYSCVDRDLDDKSKTDEDYDGILIFIKPSLIGREPRDVINYWQGRSSFPQEVITDQWFSEAQFESYRALGSYIVEAICQDKSMQMTLADFGRKAQAHNQLRFEAFQEQISLLALEHMFKEEMQHAPESYATKVRQFMESLLR